MLLLEYAWLLNSILQKTLDYIKRFNNSYSDKHTENIRTSLSREGIKEPEATQLWNLAPCSAEEANQLVPGLKNYPEEVIERLIKEISGSTGAEESLAPIRERDPNPVKKMEEEDANMPDAFVEE